MKVFFGKENKMDEEKLILLVSEYPELFDIQNESYMKGSRKQNIWKEIGDQMGVKDVVCKEKWKLLRDGYHRCLKRRQSKSGDCAKSLKKWKFEHQMEFLAPYFQERTTTASIGRDETLTGDLNTNSYSPEPMNQSSSSSSTATMFKEISARKKSQTQMTQKTSVAHVLQKYLDSRPSSTQTQTTVQTENPIDSFLKPWQILRKLCLQMFSYKSKTKYIGSFPKQSIYIYRGTQNQMQMI